MDQINSTINRARVIARSAVTYILTAVTVVNLAAPEIVAVLPDDWQGDFATAVARIVATLTGAVAVIRRVTPVPADGLTIENTESSWPAPSFVEVRRGLTR